MILGGTWLTKKRINRIPHNVVRISCVRFASAGREHILSYVYVIVDVSLVISAIANGPQTKTQKQNAKIQNNAQKWPALGL